MNQGQKQHRGTLNEIDAHYECALQATLILGVDCSDTVMGHIENGQTQTHYQITPDSFEAKTKEEERNYEAFNSYFYKNYGIKEGYCYFESPYEAFYNLIKAWTIWNGLLDESVKQSFINEVQ